MIHMPANFVNHTPIDPNHRRGTRPSAIFSSGISVSAQVLELRPGIGDGHLPLRAWVDTHPTCPLTVRRLMKTTRPTVQEITHPEHRPIPLLNGLLGKEADIARFLRQPSRRQLRKLGPLLHLYGVPMSSSIKQIRKSLNRILNWQKLQSSSSLTTIVPPCWPNPLG
jgi:hypothetical protein